MILNKFARFASDGLKYLYNRGWVSGVTWAKVQASASVNYSAANITMLDKGTSIILGSTVTAGVARSGYYVTSADVTNYSKVCVQLAALHTTSAEAAVSGMYLFAGSPRPYFSVSGWNAGLKTKFVAGSSVFELDISSLSGTQEIGFVWIEAKNGREYIEVSRIWLEPSEEAVLLTSV